MVKADAVTDHVMKMYFPIKDQVKPRLAIDAVSLNCTFDVWPSPNNEPILGLTVHLASDKCGKLKVIVLTFYWFSTAYNF